MERVEAIVVGAGVVGLAVARALAEAGRETILIEAEDAIGTGTSSRNSEVIHAGIYYPTASLKARHCVAGARSLYAYCESHGVAHRRVGKLIVATDDGQVPKLAALKAQAEANGVTDLVWLDRDAARALEPEVVSVQALWSPSTGILDSHAYMLALRGDFEAAGGMLALTTPLEHASIAATGFVVETGGAEPMRLACNILVNSAGLGAPDLARRLNGYPAARAPTAHLCKGNYFSLTGVRPPFTHLVYPIPEQAGLGIHATLDLGGQVRFGPDVEWIDRLDYTPNGARAAAFAHAIRSYWPGLPDGALVPAYCGIRPKITAPGEPAADFVIEGPADHGIAGLVNLFGIESPGLTSSLSIAGHVRDLVAGSRVDRAA
ncbi:NAD(P)/FAD-dependent oxidoreductase [Blastochloris viridis]|uniref:Aminobutyraldehyde dehydrogenase n=1 Tax=Blastochloris viridis TaxID=1079 RepID=A0A0H5BPQ4_BLAVI|nr:NAD(P)/FAD-dependent oxidoreductase [Blastochloris viridis]ALK10367.1 L-2-hydroxyglutarate oxidase LhgO [Blastochloris viridis]BAR99693.1 aminobutyraldehyde dehydrogenase [Blastochloris viridis]CUU43029.1 L-2-hydroxyglutarate oxidase LhgO [Blastochloris viridis]